MENVDACGTHESTEASVEAEGAAALPAPGPRDAEREPVRPRRRPSFLRAGVLSRRSRRRSR